MADESWADSTSGFRTQGKRKDEKTYEVIEPSTARQIAKGYERCRSQQRSYRPLPTPPAFRKLNLSSFPSTARNIGGLNPSCSRPFHCSPSTAHYTTLQIMEEVKALPRPPVLRHECIFMSPQYPQVVRRHRHERFVKESVRKRIKAFGMDPLLDSDALEAVELLQLQDEEDRRREKWATIIKSVQFMRMFTNASEVLAMATLRKLLAPIIKRVRAKVRNRKRNACIHRELQGEFLTLTASHLRKLPPFDSWAGNIISLYILPYLVPAIAAPHQIILSPPRKGETKMEKESSFFGILISGEVEVCTRRLELIRKEESLEKAHWETVEVDVVTETVRPFQQPSSDGSPSPTAAAGKQQQDQDLLSSMLMEDRIHLEESGEGEQDHLGGSFNFASIQERQARLNAAAQAAEGSVVFSDKPLACFGELPVLCHAPVQNYFKAGSTRVLYWKLDRNVYYTALEKCPDEVQEKIAANIIRLRKHYTETNYPPTPQSLQNCGRNRLFQKWPEEELWKLAQLLRPHYFRSEEVVFMQGDMANTVFFVANGLMDIYVKKTGQKERDALIRIPKEQKRAENAGLPYWMVKAKPARQKSESCSLPEIVGAGNKAAATAGAKKKSSGGAKGGKNRGGEVGATVGQNSDLCPPVEHPLYGRRVATVCAWGSLGEESVATTERRQATAVARTELDVWMCTRDELIELLTANASLFLAVRQSIAEVKSNRLKNTGYIPAAPLRKDPLLSSLKDSTITEIAKQCIPRWFPAYATVSSCTAGPSPIFIVHSGHVRVKPINEKREIPKSVVSNLRSGGIIGMACALRQEAWTYPYIYEACTAVEAWELSSKTLLSVISKEVEAGSQNFGVSSGLGNAAGSGTSGSSAVDQVLRRLREEAGKVVHSMPAFSSGD